MKTLLVMMVSLLLVMGIAMPSSYGAPVAPDQFIGGTIEEINLAGLSVTILADLGKKESLPVVSADMIKGLAKDDYVSVELDEQGRVFRIVKTTPDVKNEPEPKS